MLQHDAVGRDLRVGAASGIDLERQSQRAERLRCLVRGLSDERGHLHLARAERNAQGNAEEEEKGSAQRGGQKQEPADAPDAGSRGH